MIIGLTGKNAAGKGETANYLKTKGFTCYSLSDVIRQEATKKSMEHSRDNMINLGNELRKLYGPGFLARKINERIKPGKTISGNDSFVIDSIRSPFEVNELNKNRGFFLIGIEAPIETRFKRIQKRSRIGEAKTLKELMAQEERENLKNEANQQLDATYEMADFFIKNDGTFKALHNKIELILQKIQVKGA